MSESEAGFVDAEVVPRSQAMIYQAAHDAAGRAPLAAVIELLERAVMLLRRIDDQPGAGGAAGAPSAPKEESVHAQE